MTEQDPSNEKPTFPIPKGLIGDSDEGYLTPEEEMIQLECSDIGMDAIGILNRYPEYIEGPISVMVPEDLMSANLTVTDGIINPWSSDGGDTVDLLKGTLTKPLLGIQYSPNDMVMNLSISDPDGVNIQFHYRNMRGSYPQNGWTVSSNKLLPNGSTEIRERGPVEPSDIELAKAFISKFKLE